jgi:sulfate adenylyltransferase subunit 2
VTRYTLSHLRQLEAESIFILREVVAECERPVLLYSVGKDSSVLLHLARRAFHPAPIPFPALHIDTSFKFAEMYEFRDRICADYGIDLLVRRNEEALARGGDPESWDCSKCADLLKTQALVQALREGGFDAAFGGARRDEEQSRAKERVFSFRDRRMQWDPRRQRPELWNLYNAAHGRGESLRVFPLSNWTELDVWHYIHSERIPVVPLYLAARRPCIRRNGMWLLAGQLNRPRDGEVVEHVVCRFRTLGCQLCTGAIESPAATVEGILEETMLARRSERENRAVDRDRDAALEERKREGYF